MNLEDRRAAFMQQFFNQAREAMNMTGIELISKLKKIESEAYKLGISVEGKSLNALLAEIEKKKKEEL
jgi:hypothetical protein